VASARATAGLPLCAFAWLVGVHALIQAACVTSAILGISMSRGRAAVAVTVVLALSTAFAWRFWQASERRPPEPTPPRGPGHWIAWMIAGGAVCWAVSLWARLWVLAYQRASYDWDGLYYHIPAIHEWVLTGRVRWLDTYPDVPFVNYPMGIEAHTFLMHQLFGVSQLVDACNLWYWPLAFFAVIVLAGRLGARGPWRWFAAALLAGAPVMVCQSVTSYTDPASASCVMAAVAASALLVFHEDGTPWWTALLWGASIGLVLGSKGTGVPMSAAIVTAVVAGMALRHGKQGLVGRLPVIAVGACVMLAVGGYWYARNAYHTGNPVYPVQVKFGARVLIEGYDSARFTTNNQPAWLMRFPAAIRGPVSWLQLDAPIQGYAPIGGLGYIWPVAGIPSILLVATWALRRRPGVDPAEVALAMGVVLGLLIVQPAMWWSRFIIWVHVLGLACLGLVLHRASVARLTLVRPLAWACALAVVTLAAWESERTLAIEEARGRVESGRAHAKYASAEQMLFPGLADTPGMREVFASTAIARSEWGRAGTLLGGILALPLGQRQIHLLPPHPREEELVRLESAGVRWVIWDAAARGDVPPILRQRAMEESTYAPSLNESFHILRLPTPDR